MEWYGRNGRNLWKRVSIKKQAGTIFSAASTNPLQRQKRNSHAECWLPDKPILVRLGCFDDVCMFTCYVPLPLGTVCCLQQWASLKRFCL